MPFARRKRRTPRPAASSTAPPGNAWPRRAPNAGLAVQCWPGRGHCRRRRREWGRSCAAWRGSGLISHPQGAGHVCRAAFLSCAGLAARGLQRSSPAAQGQTIQAAPVAGALRLHARRRTVPPDAGHGLRTVCRLRSGFCGAACARRARFSRRTHLRWGLPRCRLADGCAPCSHPQTHVVPPPQLPAKGHPCAWPPLPESGGPAPAAPGRAQHRAGLRCRREQRRRMQTRLWQTGRRKKGSRRA